MARPSAYRETPVRAGARIRRGRLAAMRTASLPARTASESPDSAALAPSDGWSWGWLCVVQALHGRGKVGLQCISLSSIGFPSGWPGCSVFHPHPRVLGGSKSLAASSVISLSAAVRRCSSGAVCATCGPEEICSAHATRVLVTQLRTEISGSSRLYTSSANVLRLRPLPGKTKLRDRSASG